MKRDGIFIESWLLFCCRSSLFRLYMWKPRYRYSQVTGTFLRGFLSFLISLAHAKAMRSTLIAQSSYEYCSLPRIHMSSTVLKVDSKWETWQSPREISLVPMRVHCVFMMQVKVHCVLFASLNKTLLTSTSSAQKWKYIKPIFGENAKLRVPIQTESERQRFK